MEKNFSLDREMSPILKEKKEQRKVADAVGLSLLALFAIMFGWSFLLIRFTTNLGISNNIMAKILQNPGVNELLQISVSTLMLIIPSFILLRMTHNKARDVVLLGRPTQKIKVSFFVAAVGFCMFASQANNQLAAIFESIGLKFPSMDGELPKGVWGLVLMLLSTVVFPALLEEFMMRGVTLGVLRKFGNGFAIIASSLVFAFMHASLIQVALAFLLGLILGFITIKANSIWPAVIIHALNNFVNVVFSFLGEYISEQVLNVSFLVFLIIVFLAAGFATVTVSRDKEFLKIEKAETESSESEKIKNFIFSPWIFISILVALVFSIFLR